MELEEYIEDVLTVLKKNRELERLMLNLAEDSALATIKSTVLDIEKRVVKDRLIELTEQYLGKVDFTEKKEKDKKKRFSFVRTIKGNGNYGTAPIIDTASTTPKLTRAQRREEMIREKEAKKAVAKKKKQIRAEEKRIQRKQKVEAELKLLNEEQNG